MLYLKFYWFTRIAKWERESGDDSFFNKEKGIILTVYDRSDRKVIQVKTGENSSLEYAGFAGWLTRRYFKNINKKIKRQEKKEAKINARNEVKEQKERAANKLISALNRQCYVEIHYDREERQEYQIKKWLDEKEYSYEKLSSGRHHHSHDHENGTYYFENKDQATEFKLVWGGGN